MAATVVIKLNSPGMRQLLKSGGVQADLNRRAAAVARAAGPGFESRSTPRSTRGRAEAVTATAGARRSASKRGALIAAIGAAR